MRPRSVVVVHRSSMVAEGVAAALSKYRGIVPIGFATSVADGEGLGARADAVALDQYLPDAGLAARRLRAKGVRVVLVGDGDEEELRVPARASIAALARALVPDADDERPSRPLTSREREILSLVAKGLPGKQVARHLGISPKTVERHKARIFAKLGVPNQTAAVGFLLADGARAS